MTYMTTMEVYVSGQEHPALYDCYIDKAGTIYPMSPAPTDRVDDVMQVVLERDFQTPNVEQSKAINFLIKMNNANAEFFFRYLLPV